MENQVSYTEKLAKYVIIAGITALIYFAAKYFSSVLIYIIMAGVVSLIGRPITRQLTKIKIKGKSLNKGVAAILTLLIILIIILFVISGLIPIISNVVADLTAANNVDFNSISAPLAKLNRYLIETFSLKNNFKIESLLYNNVTKILNVNMFSSFIGSLTSILTSMAIGLFSVLFIAFFFIKDEKLLTKIITALTPDRLEKNIRKAITDVEELLSRYFVGLLIEMAGVGLLNFLGLWCIARLDVESALGIAFMTGILNIIPYVGPLMGEIMGTVLGVTLKFCSVTPIGLNVSLTTFAIIIFALLLATQMVDMLIFQPFIYSKSVKTSPLEIFIVLLIAGTWGGMFGMLAAIPAYTVVRVIAGRFFRNVKFIAKLIPEPSSDEKPEGIKLTQTIVKHE